MTELVAGGLLLVAVVGLLRIVVLLGRLNARHREVQRQLEERQRDLVRARSARHALMSLLGSPSHD